MAWDHEREGTTVVCILIEFPGWVPAEKQEGGGEEAGNLRGQIVLRGDRLNPSCPGSWQERDSKQASKQTSMLQLPSGGGGVFQSISGRGPFLVASVFASIFFRVYSRGLQSAMVIAFPEEALSKQTNKQTAPPLTNFIASRGLVKGTGGSQLLV